MAEKTTPATTKLSNPTPEAPKNPAAERKFSISTESCSDALKTVMVDDDVYCFIMNYVVRGIEHETDFDHAEQYDAFYEMMRNEVFPSTLAITEKQFSEYFRRVLMHAKGDLIHISLSSALSATYSNAVRAAAEINKTLKDRSVYVFDSLTCTVGMGHLVVKLLKMRNAGFLAADAINELCKARDGEQFWMVAKDLAALRRGGRISGLRAVNWRSRKVHPVLTFTKNGELVIEGKARNEKRLVDYLLNKIKTTGEDVVENFGKGIIYVARSSRSKLYDTILAAVRERYPEAEIRERIIGPIIGAHFGLDAVAIVHDGIARQSNK